MAKEEFKMVKWTGLRNGSLFIRKGKVKEVALVDKPNRHNTFAKITCTDGTVISPLPLTYFKRVKY